MIAELVELTKIIVEAVIGFQAKSSTWRRIYKLYLELGDIIDYSEQILERLKYADVRHYIAPTPYQVNKINESFLNLDKEIKQFINNFREIEGIITIYAWHNSSLVGFLFEAKSKWLRYFLRYYSSGKMNNEGKEIKRRIIKIVNRIDEFTARNSSYNRFNDSEPVDLLIDEVIEIDIDGKRLDFILQGQQNIEELRRLRTKFAEFIKDNCKIEDLL